MVNIKKGKIVSSAMVEKLQPMWTKKSNCKTVRTADCDIISELERCSSCKACRVNLRALYCRWSKRRGCDSSDTSCHTNDRYLRTPELKSKVRNLRKRNLRKRVLSAEEELKRLKEKVQKLLQEGEAV